MTDLPLRRYSNQAPDTTLTADLLVGAFVASVTTVDGFPPVPFTIEIETEIMQVTLIAGLDLTVDRAYDGSVAAFTHLSGVTVRHVLTADDFSHRWQDVILDRDHGLFDDEFDDGDDSAYTKVVLGTTTWIEANGVYSVIFKDQAADDVSAQLKTISGMAIGSGIQTCVRVMGTDDRAYAGVVLSSGFTTTSNVVYLFVYSRPGGATLAAGMISGTFTDATTSHFDDDFGAMVGGWIHLRLVWVSISQFRGYFSLDGVSWTDFGVGIQVITGIDPPTHFGVGVSSWGSSVDKLATFEYLRVWEP